MAGATYEQNRGRLSLPVHGGRSSTDLELIRHSYDLCLFPTYLHRNRAERLSVVISSIHTKDADLVALREDAHSDQHRLVPYVPNIV